MSEVEVDDGHDDAPVLLRLSSPGGGLWAGITAGEFQKLTTVSTRGLTTDSLPAPVQPTSHAY